MKRRLFILAVLTAMFISVIFAGRPAEARRCPFDMCVALYNECEASCNGNRMCVKACQRDYNECLCSNCGFDCGELPRAEPQAAAPRAAASHGTAKGQAPTLW